MYLNRAVLWSSQVVQERLVCQGVVGLQSSYEQIMSVDLTCRFVAPVLSISAKQLIFYMEKVGERLFCTGDNI